MVHQFSVSNPCDASPCGPGTCWQGQEPLSYLCVCPPEWTGDNCDEVAGEYCMEHCVVGGGWMGEGVVIQVCADRSIAFIAFKLFMHLTRGMDCRKKKNL